MNLIDKARMYLSRRRAAYLATFRAPAAERVLADLAIFCRARRTTFHENDRAHAVMEGRREVWLRIQEHLSMSEAELWSLYHGDDDVA